MNNNMKLLINMAKALVSCAFFTLIVWTAQQHYQKAKLNRLNNFMPRSHDYLVEITENNRIFNSVHLKEFEYYYRLLSDYRPERSDAYGMLGFCSYHLGKRQEAIYAYQKAIELNPEFFWYHYNLGVIFYKEGRFQDAARMLNKAVTLKPQQTIAYIQTSKRIYLPIMARYIKNFDGSMLNQLKLGYHKSYFLLELIKNHQNVKETEHLAAQIEQQIDIELF